MTQTIYFIRHGESQSNAGGIIMEHAAIPITARGQMQANIIADALNITPALVLVSEHIRTQQTPRPFCGKHQCTAQTRPILNEFSVISHELIEGMTGKERRPIADAYCAEAQLTNGWGLPPKLSLNLITAWVNSSAMMHTMPDQTVIFGHGIWFGLLVWKLMGFDVTDSQTMKAFRRFQSGLPLCNGATYKLQSETGDTWSVHKRSRNFYGSQHAVSGLVAQLFTTKLKTYRTTLKNYPRFNAKEH